MAGRYGDWVGIMIVQKPLSLILFFIGIIAGCDSHNSSHNVVTPGRPASVPASAVWAGGMDGGMWYDCRAKVKNYECVTYHEENGSVLDRGEYAMSFKREPDVCKQMVTDEKLIFVGSNYGEIYLKNDFDLKADGIIDFQSSGVRQRFECGKEVGNK